MADKQAVLPLSTQEQEPYLQNTPGGPGLPGLFQAYNNSNESYNQDNPNFLKNLQPHEFMNAYENMRNTVGQPAADEFRAKYNAAQTQQATEANPNYGVTPEMKKSLFDLQNQPTNNTILK